MLILSVDLNSRGNMLRFFCFFLIWNLVLFSQSKNGDDPVEVFKEQRASQGEIIFAQAQDYFKQKLYKSCIEKTQDFLILYPKHTSRLAVLKLLSEAYYKDEQLEKSIQTDYKIYKDYPTVEEGLISYFEAARKLLKTGRKEEAVDILEKLRTQMYSYKLAKDAEIELNQLKILGEIGDLKDLSGK